MSEVYLNTLKGFDSINISTFFTDEHILYVKVLIDEEAFWIRECKRDKNNLWHGKVDNVLLCTDEHGLKLHDKVSFHT